MEINPVNLVIALVLLVIFGAALFCGGREMWRLVVSWCRSGPKRRHKSSRSDEEEDEEAEPEKPKRRSGRR